MNANPNSIPISDWDMTTHILGSEGGYVNDKDDLGGATKFGVTLATLKRLKLDINNDNVIDINDVKALRLADAFKIFEDKYLNANNINNLPDMLKFSVYDMNVNSGRNSAKILQKLINTLENKKALKIDGVIGSGTMNYVNHWYALDPVTFTDAYFIARRNYYFHLGDIREKNRKYCVTEDGEKAGWINIRAEEFLSPKYVLTDEAFNARISKWS